MTVSAVEVLRASHSREEEEAEEAGEEEADRVEETSTFGEVGTRRSGEFISATRWISSRQPPP